MNKFLSKFKPWAHALAVGIISAATLYATNDAVHTAVNNALGPNSKFAGFLLAASSIVLAYANSQKPVVQ